MWLLSFSRCCPDSLAKSINCSLLMCSTSIKSHQPSNRILHIDATNPGSDLSGQECTSRRGCAPARAFREGACRTADFTACPSPPSSLNKPVSSREPDPPPLHSPNSRLAAVSCARVPPNPAESRAAADPGHRPRNKLRVRRAESGLSCRSPFSSRFGLRQPWRNRPPPPTPAEQLSPPHPLLQLRRDRVPGRWPTTESCPAASPSPYPVPPPPASAWLFPPASVSGGGGPVPVSAFFAVPGRGFCS